MGGPVKLLYIIMFDILKGCQKCIFGSVKGEKFSQCLYQGDTAPSVNSSVVFDAPTPGCGVSYHCRIVPSINVAYGAFTPEYPILLHS